MPRYAALSSLTAAAFAASLLIAGPASASGGHRDPAPSGDVPQVCPTADWEVGTSMMEIEANGAGCLLVDVSSGTMMLQRVLPATGWTSDIREGTGRIEVRFTESFTDDRVDVRVEPGETEIK